MIDAIKTFFQTRIQAEKEKPGSHEHALQLATAALLLEMTRADHRPSSAEEAQVMTLLKREFQLSESEANELAALAEDEIGAAVSLHPFTSLINAHFTDAEKIRLIEMLWRVALVDNELHKWEESLVRKVADLIHVYHRDFIQAKHRVLGH